LTEGLGLTLIVKTSGLLVHVELLNVEVAITLMVAVIMEDELFVAVNGGKFPDPLDPIPMFMLLFVQLYVAPNALLVNTTCPLASFAQSVMSGRLFITGTGFTEILNNCGVPIHVLLLFV
jgi:hypothetical protein